MLKTYANNGKTWMKAAIMTVLVLSLVMSFCFASAADGAQTTIKYAEGSYGEYLEKVLGNAAPGEGEIVLNGSDYIPVEGGGHKILNDYEGMPGASLLTATDGDASWKFTVPADGWYNLEFVYYPYEGTGSSIIRSINIDGKAPYSNAANVTFHRLWDDEKAVGEALDDAGNEVRSPQVEVPEWITTFARDESGQYFEPLKFYLTAGEHTLTLDAVKEPMLINKMTFKVAEEASSYADVLAAWKSQGLKEIDGEVIKIQGENSYRKSHMSIYPVNDRASGITENFDGSGYNYNKQTLNSIGGDKWQQVGQWIEWIVDVPAGGEGLYALTLRAKQNVVDGNQAARAVYVNGELPYAEAAAITFNHSTSYELNTFADAEGNPYLFHLKEGENVIRLENVIGDFSEIVTIGRSAVTSLNECYLQILMITGTSPDFDRDYRFNRMIPEVLDELEYQAGVLNTLADMIYEQIGENNSNQSSLRQIAQRLQKMHDRYDKIAEMYSSFKSDLGTLANMVNDMAKQPLQVDYLLLGDADAETMPKKAEAGFFKGMWHEIRLFISSFTTDYTNIGATSKSEDAITVWYAGGIEQCKIIKQMATDDFSTNYNIPVNLQYIQMTALLPATLAGRSPDVALGQAAADPINYAMRDAAYDLSKFDDFEEVVKAFPESATMQFTYEGGVYALPETITFPVMFYRTDIVSKNGWTLPKTWEDVYALLPEMQKSNMNFGYPKTTTLDVTPFVHFLYQYGGEVYKNNAMETDIDSPEGINAFIEWTDLYTTYQFEKTLDFNNRMRRGEMPVGINDYITGYNTLMLSAPEIKGLWSFATIPGHVQADGTINYTAAATVTGCILLSQSDNKEGAWEFMKWWTGTEAQTRYSTEVESVLGAGARNHTANLEAIKQLPWTNDELNVILDQLEHTKGYPQVPGGYYSARHIYNAYVDVVLSAKDQRESLLDRAAEINTELYNKRKEYGLSLPERD